MKFVVSSIDLLNHLAGFEPGNQFKKYPAHFR